MAEALKEKVEQVIWDAEKDAFHSVRALVLEEMKYRIYPGIIWDLQKWARSKSEEHRNAQGRIEKILLAVRTNVEDHRDHCQSLQKLVMHHRRIAGRYNSVVMACDD
jgi:hypothetical protein